MNANRFLTFQPNCQHFYIDEQTLFTYHSVSCIRKDHVHIGVPLSGYDSPPRGTLLVMDNRSPDCSHKAQISTGHLHGRDIFHYGRFSFKIQLAHALEDTQLKLLRKKAGIKPPTVAPNAMSCFALYTNETVHNEIAACFRSDESDELTLSFYVGEETDGDKIHLKRKTTKRNLSDAFHDFSIYWSQKKVTFLIDDEEIWTPDYHVLPWKPMTLRIILRPFNIPSTYEGSAQMAIGSVRYEPILQ